MYDQNYLSHHGILGMKWGVRRYQNEDGSLTSAGKKRYAKGVEKKLNTYDRQMRSLTIREHNSAYAHQQMRKAAEKARVLGNEKKAEEYTKQANKMRQVNHAYWDMKQRVGIDYMAEVQKLKESGLSYKVKQLEFADSTRVGRKLTNVIMREYGNIPPKYRQSNVASGNKWKVRDKSQLSDKKQKLWSTETTTNSIRPQRVETYYY